MRIFAETINFLGRWARSQNPRGLEFMLEQKSAFFGSLKTFYEKRFLFVYGGLGTNLGHYDAFINDGGDGYDRILLGI